MNKKRATAYFGQERGWCCAVEGCGSISHRFFNTEAEAKQWAESHNEHGVHPVLVM